MSRATEMWTSVVVALLGAILLPAMARPTLSDRNKLDIENLLRVTEDEQNEMSTNTSTPGEANEMFWVG